MHNNTYRNAIICFAIPYVKSQIPISPLSYNYFKKAFVKAIFMYLLLNTITQYLCIEHNSMIQSHKTTKNATFLCTKNNNSSTFFSVHKHGNLQSPQQTRHIGKKWCFTSH